MLTVDVSYFRGEADRIEILLLDGSRVVLTGPGLGSINLQHAPARASLSLADPNEGSVE